MFPQPFGYTKKNPKASRRRRGAPPHVSVATSGTLSRFPSSRLPHLLRGHQFTPDQGAVAPDPDTTRLLGHPGRSHRIAADHRLSGAGPRPSIQPTLADPLPTRQALARARDSCSPMIQRGGPARWLRTVSICRIPAPAPSWGSRASSMVQPVEGRSEASCAAKRLSPASPLVSRKLTKDVWGRTWPGTGRGDSGGHPPTQLWIRRRDRERATTAGPRVVSTTRASGVAPPESPRLFQARFYPHTSLVNFLETSGEAGDRRLAAQLASDLPSTGCTIELALDPRDYRGTLMGLEWTLFEANGQDRRAESWANNYLARELTLGESEGWPESVESTVWVPAPTCGPLRFDVIDQDGLIVESYPDRAPRQLLGLG